MVELFILAALAVAALVGFLFLLLKLALWTVLLPFRILFKLVMIPVWIVAGGFGLLAGAVALPLLVVALGGMLLVGILGALLAVLLPLVPFALLGLMFWALFRRRPVAVGQPREIDGSGIGSDLVVDR